MTNRTTNASSTETHHGFRESLINHDGTCVVTNQRFRFCEATHYFPHTKGGEVRLV